MNDNRKLLDAARATSVDDLSQAAKEVVQEEVIAAREKWKRETAEAIAEYNDLIAEHGIFSEGERRF